MFQRQHGNSQQPALSSFSPSAESPLELGQRGGMQGAVVLLVLGGSLHFGQGFWLS
jgi:hypothetical protein